MIKLGSYNKLLALNKDKRFQYPISKDQQFQIGETSVHLLSHWLTTLVKDRYHMVNPGCQGWWLAVQNGTIAMVRPILK